MQIDKTELSPPKQARGEKKQRENLEHVRSLWRLELPHQARGIFDLEIEALKYLSYNMGICYCPVVRLAEEGQGQHLTVIKYESIFLCVNIIPTVLLPSIGEQILAFRQRK